MLIIFESARRGKKKNGLTSLLFFTSIYSLFDAGEQKKNNQMKPEIPAMKEARSMPVFASNKSS